MKLIAIILCSVFLGKGCSATTQNDLEKATIEYVANTRGFYQKITIQNKKLYVSKDRNAIDKGAVSDIDDNSWKTLIGYFDTLDLETLANHKAPSEKRFYDGAAIANLKIIYKDKTYISASFDHGNPPVAFAALVNKIVSFTNE